MSSDRTVSSKPQPEPTPAQQAETIRNALQALTDYVDESPDVFIDTELAKRISVARAALRAASVSAEAAQQAETLEQAEILERLSRSQYLRDHVTGPHDTIEALRAGAAALRAAPVRYCDDARLVGGTGGWFYDVVTPDGTILASIPAAALRAAVPMKQCSNGCAPHESCPQSRAAVSGEGTWQPIATAPKDADLLLLCGPLDGVRSGYWDDDSHQWMSVETKGLTGGWMTPTLWQPMPAAPQEDSQ